MATYHGDLTQFSNVRFQKTRHKSLVIAYLLWFFFGMLGLHRFYMDRLATGFVQLGIVFAQIFIIFVNPSLSIAMLGALGLWVLIDGVLLPFME
ncbi:TM2 domain-containing protein [Sphingopyxis sp.]|uniref:TM2 domain-containing protein n=1 Tax=Sphingopyxis sp. TaxID=1908224 RepID=UPI002EDAA5C9